MSLSNIQTKSELSWKPTQRIRWLQAISMSRVVFLFEGLEDAEKPTKAERDPRESFGG